jgi:hypothetical protein
MATQRQLGQELDQNVRRGPNMSVLERDQIIGMLNGGFSSERGGARIWPF